MKRPLNKVSGGSIGGGIGAIILAWLYQEFTGKSIPMEVAIGLASILGGAIAYLIPLEQEAIRMIKRKPDPDIELLRKEIEELKKHGNPN